MIDRERLCRTFLDLVRIDSPSGEEREVRRYCRERLRDAEFVCQVDAAGNLIAQRSGTRPTAVRLFFCGHMDTVQPTDGIAVREVDGVFRTDGRTILGGDDKAALAEIIEAVTVIAEQGLPHGDLLVVFTVGEEIGHLGARALATEVLAGATGFVLDASGAPGSIVTAAPSHARVVAEFHGRAAHAGFCPEAGASAIQAAALAVAAMQLGRLDPESTANIGLIAGGTATNIVPDYACVRGEARSLSEQRLAAQVEHMRARCEAAARAIGVAVDVQIERGYAGYRLAPTDPAPALAACAWRRRFGGEPTFRATGGGSDANEFLARGIPCCVLACGYHDAHAVTEHVPIAELVATTEWLLAIVAAAA